MEKETFSSTYSSCTWTPANLIFVFFLFIVQWLHSSFPHPFLLQSLNQPFSSILSCDSFQCFWCYLLHKLLTISFCQMFLESKQKDDLRLQQTAGTNTVWDFLRVFFILYMWIYLFKTIVWQRVMKNNGLISQAGHERQSIYVMILKLVTNTCCEQAAITFWDRKSVV